MAKTYYLQFGTSGDPRQFPGLAPTFLCFNNNGSAVTPPSIASVTGATGFYSFTWGTTSPIVFMADAATTSPGTSGRYVTGTLDPNDRSDEYGNTMVALGSTNFALITSAVALGTTSVALGTTGVAQGVLIINAGMTTIALGSTGVAQGSLIINAGVTTIALGNTGLAVGNINTGLGSTGVALGTLNLALGTSLTTGMVNEGLTLVAIGNTLSTLAFFGATLTGLGNTVLSIATIQGTTSSSIGSTAIDPTTVMGFLIRAQEIREGNQTYTKATGILDMFSRGATLLREKTISDTSTQTTKS